MRKIALVLSLILLLAPVFVFSQDAPQDSGVIKEMGQKMMMHHKMKADKVFKEGKMDKTGGMCLMNTLMQKQMLSTSDAGVIVLSGNKLYKYNKDLKLVNEAEIPVDFEGMKKMMDKMKENCPMHKMMMGSEGKDMAGSGDGDESDEDNNDFEIEIGGAGGVEVGSD